MNEIISKYSNGIDTDKIILKSEIAIDKLSNSIDELTDKVVKTTAEFSNKTVGTIKKYPLHSALIAGTIGVIAGAIIARE